MSLTNLVGYNDILAVSGILEGINTNEFVVRTGGYPNTNLLTCDTKNLIVNINGELSVATFGISSLPNSIISTNISGTFEALGIGSNLSFGSNSLGVVASPTFTNITGTLLTAAQPNITSLGTLTSLSVTGSLLLSNQTANALLHSNGSEIVSSVSINNPLTFSAGTLGLNYNNSNLQLTSNAINTIQNIATTSSPTFSAITITNAVGCGSLNCGGNAIITGNLTVNGTTTTVNSTTVSVESNFLQLANANSSTNSLDIGIYGEYYASSSVRYTGLFYKSSNLGYQLFENLTVQPGSTVTTTDASYQLAALSIAALSATTGNFSGNLTTNVTSSMLSTNGSGVIEALSVGNGLSLSSNTLTASINSTNLMFSSGAINTSQGISTGASPTFTGLTLSGLAASTPIYANGSQVLTSGSYGNGLSFNTALTTHIDGTNLVYSGSTITTSQGLQTGSSPTFTGLTVSGLTANTPVYANGSQVLTSGSYGNGLSFSAGTLTTHIDGTNLVYSGSTITTAQGITTSSSPQFSSLTLSGLTASTPVYANASKVLTSGSYGNGLSWSSGTLTTNIDGTNLIYSSGVITTSQALQTGSSPTFTGLTLSGLTANTPIYANGSEVLTSGSYGNGLSWSSGTLTTNIDGTNLVYSGSTITTSQALQTSSSPKFTGLTLTGLTASTPVYANASPLAVHMAMVFHLILVLEP